MATMLQSPSKRRRLNSSQPQAVEDASGSQEPPPPPTTPRRASYLSPTKSSLARSHPHLATRSTRRSATEPRGTTLRDEILDGSSQHSHEPKTIARIRQSAGTNGTDDAALAPEEENPTEEHTAATIDAQPAQLKQPNPRKRQIVEDKSREKVAHSEEPVPAIITPKLVPRKEPGASPVVRARSGSPELPPTPVALGLSAAPERPRGLASSSSPRGSKMNGGSRRRRTRSGGPVTSSPLKPRAGLPAEHGDGHEPKDEANQDEADEAQESELDQEDQENEEDRIRLEKQKSRLRLLRNELKQLHSSVQCLEKSVDADDPSLEALPILRRSATATILPQNWKVDDQGSKTPAYLTRFAPGNLKLVSHTELKMIGDETKIIHTLRVEAPEPWLPNTLCCVFEVAVDAKNVQIEQVQLKEAVIAGKLCTVSSGLLIYRWMHDRLGHPLHKYDVGGVIWGLGIWFNAIVERAKVFRRIDLKYKEAQLDARAWTSKQEQELSRETCIELAKYLGDTQQSAIDPDISVSIEGKESKTKLLLDWEIRLDWAGYISSDVEISTSGIPPNAESGLKTVFRNLTPRIGVEGAFAHIWGMIHSEDEEFKMGNS